MHGGAKGSGAPVGNRNAVTHGLHSAVQIEDRKALHAALTQLRESVLRAPRNLD